MAHPRISLVRRGASSNGVAAALVGAVVLVAVGYGLGRNQGAPAMDSAEQIERIAQAVAERVNVSADDARAEAELIAQAVHRHLAGHLEQLGRAGGVASSQPSSTTGPPPIVFEPSSVDLGVVPLNTDSQATVTIRNVGDEPLKIVKLSTTCKCTTVEDLSGRVLEPGAVVEITAVVDGRSAPSSGRSRLDLIVEGYDEVASLSIFSLTGRAIMSDPVAITPTDSLSGSLLVSAASAEPFRIIAVDGSEPVYVDGFDAAADEPRARYEVAWDLTGYDESTCLDDEGRKMPGWYVIETDHPEAPIVDVRVRHTCTLPEPMGPRLWYIPDYHVILGNIESDRAADFTVSVRWRGGVAPNDTIGEVRSESDQFFAALLGQESSEEGTSYRVRITPTRGHRGLLYGTVRFASRLTGQSQQITVIGRVVDETTTAQ